MKKISFSGILLIILGVVFLLMNFNMLTLDLENIIKMWPILLILIGIGFFITPNFQESDNSDRESNKK